MAGPRGDLWGHDVRRRLDDRHTGGTGLTDRVQIINGLLDDVLLVDETEVDSMSRLYAPFVLRDMFWNHKAALEQWIASE